MIRREKGSPSTPKDCLVAFDMYHVQSLFIRRYRFESHGFINFIVVEHLLQSKGITKSEIEEGRRAVWKHEKEGAA